CTQAASHATCSHKNCRDGTPTACQAEGTGSMAVFGQYTGIQDNNSFETNTSTQDNPTFTGFTYTENAGDGTANVSQYFGDSKHGASSLRIKLTGTTSYAFTGSTCNAMLPNTAYYAYVAAKHLNGKRPTNARVYVLEYSDAGCTLNLVSNSGTMSNLVTPSWKDYGVSFTSAATTNFYKIGFEARDGNSDTLFDNLDLKAASHHTPWVRVPSGGGAVTYNIRDYKLFNPLSSYVQSEGGFAYASGFCLGGWVYTDWAGDDGVTHYIAAVPGTVGNNNSWHISKNSSNRVQFILHDSAGTFRYTFYTVTNVEWTSGNWKYIEICSNNTDNILQLRHYNVNNSTWYTAVTTYDTGTGVQNGQANYISVGSSLAAVPLNGYIRNLTIGPYNAIWPMLGWNNGRIPAARPY
ncbi:MAG: hypothetical protein KKC03_14120, partial [Bacteroidetes bacterium]|nr:hypothetical protein [Bacteroidota bacterium]